MKVHTFKPQTAYGAVTGATSGLVAGLDVYGGQEYRDTVARGVDGGTAALCVAGGLGWIVDSINNGSLKSLVLASTEFVKAGGLVVQACGSPVPGAFLTGLGLTSNLLINSLVADPRNHISY